KGLVVATENDWRRENENEEQDASDFRAGFSGKLSGLYADRFASDGARARSALCRQRMALPANLPQIPQLHHDSARLLYGQSSLGRHGAERFWRHRRVWHL